MAAMTNPASEALLAGLGALWEYLSAHTLTCLVPAMFIAGAIGAFAKREAILRYLGPTVSRWVSYPVAAVSGTLLAVCSCTVLPLFAGIHRKGAGLGPATAFLYSGPAINVLAIALTAKVLGWQLGLARAMAAIALSVVVGLVMATVFRREGTASPDGAGVTGAGATTVQLETDGGQPVVRWRTGAVFVLLVALLVAGTTSVGLLVKASVVAGLAIAIAWLAWTMFDREELRSWGAETWWLAKQILPILLVGAFVVGLIGHFVPPETFRDYLGDNGPGSVALASVVGTLLYMPTLLEVPIVGDTFGYTDGVMAPGPALALLLAGPAVSLPSIVVIYRIIGARRTVAYIGLVVVASTLAGLVYGAVAG